MASNPPPNNGNSNGGNGQIIPFHQKVNGLRTLLEKMKGQFANALPQHVKVERLLRVVMTAVQKTPQLVETDQNSFLCALLECCQLGLEPNTSLGHAWLVPFRNNKRNGRLEAQVIPGYKGLIKLAYQSGMVTSVNAYVVREKDDFDYRYGSKPRIVHHPWRKDDAGPMVAVYATAMVKLSPVPQFIVLEKWQCNEIRERFSASPNKGPWIDNPEEMSQKSAVRRLMKWVPSDTERTALARAVALDERAEWGIEQEFDSVIDLGPDAVADPSDPGPAAEGQPPGSAAAPAAAAGDPPPPADKPASKLDALTASKKAEREGKAG
jgi:recombination protein RecT